MDRVFVKKKIQGETTKEKRVFSFFSLLFLIYFSRRTTSNRTGRSWRLTDTKKRETRSTVTQNTYKERVDFLKILFFLVSSIQNVPFENGRETFLKIFNEKKIVQKLILKLFPSNEL